jgi:PhnB protein
MQLSLHLCFAGNCRAAFEFYASALGGTELSLLAYGDSPAGADVPSEMRARIVHGSIHVGGVLLSGADVPEKDWKPLQGFYALLTVRGTDEAARLFNALADGGDVRMPLGKTFWSPAFGVVVDKFGVPWEVNAN